MLEKQFQTKVIKRLENRGWYVIKLIQTNKNGIPDIIAIKYGRCVFIELKAKNGKESKLQQYRQSELKQNNIHVWTLYAKN